MIHIPISKLALVMMLCFLLTTGCGVFQQKKPHYNSCGPDAIFHAFRWHGVESSRIKISKEILEDHKAYSLLRDVLSIFNSDLNEITFPQEIKDELLKHHIKTRSVSLEEFKELKILALCEDSGKGNNLKWAAIEIRDQIKKYLD